MNLFGYVSNALSWVVPFVVVLGLLVLLHEAGHFVTARMFGVRPYIFSVGFGWRLAGIQRRGGRLRFSFGPLKETEPDPTTGTDYRLSWIPFGGYVLLQGESLNEPVVGDPREFRTRPRWQQMIVYAAGVTLNLILAYVLIAGLFWKMGYVYERPTGSPIIAAIKPDTSAASSGLAVGDKLLQVEGRDAGDPDTLYEEILCAPNTTRNLLVERGTERLTIPVAISMDPKYHLGDPGFEVRGSWTNPLIRVVEPGGPADRAGLKSGDTIVKAGNREGPMPDEIIAIIRASADATVHLEVLREGVRSAYDITPTLRGDKPIIGVQFADGPVKQVGLGGALVGAADWCRGQSALLFVTLKEMVRGRISPRAMSGPIELAKVSRERWREGSESFLQLLAFVSLQLGILNLMPIPGLDGGHMLILLVEGTIRRELPERVKQWVITSGVVALLLFTGMVIYFDVVKAWL